MTMIERDSGVASEDTKEAMERGWTKEGRGESEGEGENGDRMRGVPMDGRKGRKTERRRWEPGN